VIGMFGNPQSHSPRRGMERFSLAAGALLVAGGVTASSILQAGRTEVLPSWSQGAAARFSFEASRRALDHKRRCQLLVASGVT
jgi:hypothetical protein